MSRWRGLGLFAVGVVGAAVLLPLLLGGSDQDRTATALVLAGPAAGAALSLAVGRPNLAVGALAGVGAYVSGALAVRGVDVPLAVVLATAVGAAAGALVAVVTARLDIVGLLASTLLASVALSALTQALPQQSGGQAGLGPLPPLGTSLPSHQVLRLTATGDLHAALGFALLVGVAGVALLSGLTGARWRAVGSDRPRAASTGLHPLRAELVVLALGGGLAAAGGAMGAHITAVATPDLFAADVVTLPLLAALLAGRGSVVGAVVTAIATGLAGGLVLPALHWRGPPSATALALALLAVAVVVSLLPGGGAARRPEPSIIDADAPWPFGAAEFAGTALDVVGLEVRAGPIVVVRDLSMAVGPGQLHGLVGPNGAGKSSVLTALASGTAPGVRVGGAGLFVLQPQAGGGFPACTVDETLQLAAGGGGRDRKEAVLVASEWRSRLGLADAGSILCTELSAGQRRFIDLARVLLRRPNVLLCDEPLAGLDPGSRAAAVSLLHAAAAAGLTIVMAEHDQTAVAALATTTTELSRYDVPPPLTEPPL